MSNWQGEIINLMPYSDELERGVLGTLLINIAMIDRAQMIRPEMFQIIEGVDRPFLFKCIAEYSQDNDKISAGKFIKWAESNQTLPRIGDKIRILEFVSKAITDPRAFEDAAVEVAQCWKKRRLISLSLELIQSAAMPGGTVENLVQDLDNDLNELITGNTATQIVAVPDLVPVTIARLDERVQAARSNTPIGLHCGIAAIDGKLQGFRESDLIIIGGRSGMGKTAFARSIILNMARRGIPVLIFSLEESLSQWADKLTCLLCGIDYWKIRTGKMSDDEIRRFNEAAGKMEQLPIFIDDTASINMTEVRMKTRVMKKKHGIGAVFTDYLQIIEVEGKQRRDIEVGDVAKQHKASAKALKIPHFALSQMSRESEKRPDKIPSVTDLADSDVIQRTADFVLLIYRPEYYGVKMLDGETKPTDGLARIYMPKAKDVGDVGHADIFFDKTNSEFRNEDISTVRFSNSTGAGGGVYNPSDDRDNPWNNPF